MSQSRIGDCGRELPPGLYRLHWDDGGFSLAAVGILHDGTRWFAPVNWTSATASGVASTRWDTVMRAEPIAQPLPASSREFQRRQAVGLACDMFRQRLGNREITPDDDGAALVDGLAADCAYDAELIVRRIDHYMVAMPEMVGDPALVDRRRAAKSKLRTKEDARQEASAARLSARAGAKR